MATDRVVTRDGTALHVEERGEPDAPVTLVLMHGWVLDRRTWGRQLADLPGAIGQPVRILAHDHRGHGGSDPAAPGTATIGQLADDLADLLAARVPTGPVVLAGHSMGGMTIMALAERHPALFAERVAGAAFVATSSGGLSAGVVGVPAPVGRLLRRFERRTAPRLIAGGNRQPGRATLRLGRPFVRWLVFGTRVGPVEMNLTAEMVAAHWPATFAAFRDTLDEHERYAALAACQGRPMVVLCGSRDRLCPPAHAYRIVDGVGGGQLVEYADAGHMLPLEHPTEVTAEIAAVVRRVCAAAVPRAS